MTAGIAVAEHWPASKTTSNEKRNDSAVAIRSEPQHSILAGYFAPSGKSGSERQLSELCTSSQLAPAHVWSGVRRVPGYESRPRDPRR
jgi:hypothetical protein